MNAIAQRIFGAPGVAGPQQRLTRTTQEPRVNPQTLARVTGVLFLITYATSIPAALALYVPVLTDPSYINGAGAADNGVFLGAFLELLLIIANIGTAIALFPILKRLNESLALGFVAARVVESAFIAVGVLSLLTLVTLRQEAAGLDAGSLAVVGKALVALHDWTFLLGPGFTVGVGNGMILGYLLYRSGLVPRPMAALGLVGGPLLCASGIAIVFGVIEQGGLGQTIAVVPEFFWELSLGIYLTVKGFRPSAVAFESANGRTAGHDVVLRTAPSTPEGGLYRERGSSRSRYKPPSSFAPLLRRRTRSV